ncbi:hypothetical protein B0H14DRAFT_3628097 [Mycena olivaceomarginata]|nr:hypothetical protein B0H14DRAFT_3628097 [Mycena olivaceomarginata]
MASPRPPEIPALPHAETVHTVDSIPSPDRLDHVLQFGHAPPPSRSCSVRIRSPHSSATSSAFSDSDSPHLRLANALQNGPAAPRAAPPQPPPRPGAPISPNHPNSGSGAGSDAANPGASNYSGGVVSPTPTSPFVPSPPPGSLRTRASTSTARPLYTHHPSSPTPVLACHRFMRDTGWWYTDLHGKGAGDGRGRTPRDALARARAPGDVPSPPSPVLRKSGSSASLLLCERAISGLTGDSGPHQTTAKKQKLPLPWRGLAVLVGVPQQQSQAPSQQQPPVDSPQQQQQQRQDTDEWRHTVQARAILGNLIVPNGEQLTSTDPYSEVEDRPASALDPLPLQYHPPLQLVLSLPHQRKADLAPPHQRRTGNPHARPSHTPSPPTPTWGGTPVTTPGSDANGPTLRPNRKSIDLPGLNTFAPRASANANARDTNSSTAGTLTTTSRSTSAARPLYTHRPSSPVPMLACRRFMRDTGWWYVDLRSKGAGDGRGRTLHDALVLAPALGDMPSPPSPVLRKSGSSASLLLHKRAVSGLTGHSGVSNLCTR